MEQPSQRPDLNPFEILWTVSKSQVCATNSNELKRVVKYLPKIVPETC